MFLKADLLTGYALPCHICKPTSCCQTGAMYPFLDCMDYIKQVWAGELESRFPHNVINQSYFVT